MKKVILAVAVFVIGLIFYSLFSSENINSLEGGFEELDFVRNENNTGPVRRVYAFSVEDTLWSQIQKHADLLPHTKYGTTEVFYFLEDQVSSSEIKLNLGGISSQLKSKTLAYAVKDGQGRLTIKRYPFD